MQVHPRTRPSINDSIGSGILTGAVNIMLLLSYVYGYAFGSYGDNARLVAPRQFMGKTGFISIAIAVLVATVSPINASLYITGKLAAVIVQIGELPRMLECSFRTQHLEGTLTTVVLALVPLSVKIGQDPLLASTFGSSLA